MKVKDELLWNTAQRIEALEGALMECEEYFDGIADCDCDQDGYIPNEEMKLLMMVRAALKGETI